MGWQIIKLLCRYDIEAVHRKVNDQLDAKVGHATHGNFSYKMYGNMQRQWHY